MEITNCSKERLIQINKILIEEYKTQKQLGVLAGMSGLALFQFYYSKFLDDQEHADLGVEILNHCIENLNNGKASPTYCSGFAGMSWAFIHLEQEGFIDMDDELLTELDAHLCAIMVFNMKSGNYDFLHGAIGYGFYFLKRFKNTKSEKLKARYKTYLLGLIGLLLKVSETTGNMTKWLSIVNIETGEKGYNLSLSHGMSSIVNFLSRLYIYDDFRNKVEGMLCGSVNYILSFKSENENTLSLFPSYIKEDGSADWKSRVAWCYGDLGIAISLWRASKVLNNLGLGVMAIETLKHTTKRLSEESSLVVDAGICHGSYGNSQIFNYMYNETNEESFKKAASFWLQDGLNKAIFEDGYAGYKQWSGVNKDWRKELTILEGVAGIGLCIISHLSKSDTNWDECLLIS